jgi:hypothetical protein
VRLSLGSVGALTAFLLIAFAVEPDNVRSPERAAAENKPPTGNAKSTTTRVRPGTATSAPRATDKHITEPLRPIVVEPEPVDHPLTSDVVNRSTNEARIAAALKTQVDFEITPRPFMDAIDLIARHFQISIVIDQVAFEAEHINDTSEVALKIPGITLSEMFHWLFSQMHAPIGYEIRRGALWISTREKIDEDQTVVAYDCRDLIPRGWQDLAADAPASFGGGMYQVAPTTASKPETAAPARSSSQSPSQWASAVRRRAARLISVVKTAGGDADWEEIGGGYRPLIYFQGLFIALQNPFAHRRMRQVLADIRWMRLQGAFAPAADSLQVATNSGQRSETPKRSPNPTLEWSSDVAERSKTEARIVEALRSPVDFQIKLQSFKDSIDLIAAHYRIAIVTDERALEDANVNLATKVDVNIPGITLDDLLHWLFVQVNCPLEYEVCNGALLISTLDRLNEDESVVAYDCRDLLDPANPAVWDTLERRGQRKLQAPNGRSVGRVPWIQSLISEVRSEGPDPSIAEFDGLLIIRQSARDHERTKRLLAAVRLMKKDGASAGLAEQFVDPKGGAGQSPNHATLAPSK